MQEIWGWGLGICISKLLPGDTKSTGLETTVSGPLLSKDEEQLELEKIQEQRKTQGFRGECDLRLASGSV